jgi:hypothetical protein
MILIVLVLVKLPVTPMVNADLESSKSVSEVLLNC